MTKPAASIVVIRKMAAAQRQIDAAIRMYLSEEDKLAVYTVAAAALKILRDVMKGRGRSFVAEQWQGTLVSLARNLLENRPSAALDYVHNHAPDMYQAVQILAEKIKEREQDGNRVRTNDLGHVTVSVGVESEYARRVDLPANFLKHADRDAHGHWEEGGFAEEPILLDACEAYHNVMSRITPEMLVFMTLLWIEKGDLAIGTNEESFPYPWQVVAKALEGVASSERRAACTHLLTEKKDVISDLLRASWRHVIPE